MTFFSHLRHNRLKRLICAFLALNLIAEVVSPSVALALTAGPASPEFSSFEPVATTDMVNEFTGDFTYNIPVLNLPGPDGGGYSMSLSYHSGVSSQEEASWVGYGWTLNPGAINRNKRGYPDEFKGVTVEQFSKSKPNFTETSKFDINMEYNGRDAKKQKKIKQLEEVQKVLSKVKDLMGDIVSMQVSGLGDVIQDLKDEESGPADVSVSLSHSIRFNNYSGFSIANGLGVGVFGAANVSMNRSGGQNTYGFSVNPIGLLRELSPSTYKRLREKTQKVFRKNATEGDKNMASKEANKGSSAKNEMRLALQKMGKAIAAMPAHNIGRMPKSWFRAESYNAPAVPYSVAKTKAFSWNFSTSVEFNPAAPVGIQVGVAGHINMSATEGQQDRKAYGYMYAGEHNADSEEDVVHDYQLEKESTFNRHDNNLAVPLNNADHFSVTGGNVMGGFRFRHNQIGVYYPNKMDNLMKIRQAGIELGIGGTLQFGLDIGGGKQRTTVDGKWKFYDAPGGSMPVYSSELPQMRFTNDPGGEIDYSSSFGSDDLAYATVDKQPSSGGQKRLSLNSSTSYSMDAAKATSSSKIDYEFYSDPNDDTKHYVAGIHVTGQDGNKSHYLLPVYTRREAALSIGVDENKDGKMLTSATLEYDSPLNNRTVTGHKIDEQYAATFLLTSNTAWNYVDADNINGPSEGDLGGWTRFDYKQIYGGAVNNWYRYRSPYNGLFYNGGRMVDNTDQVGSMTSGEKEVYYLKSIESKSHIAFFVTNKTAATTFTADFPIASYPSLYSNGQPVSTVTLQLTGSGTDRHDGLDAKHISSGKDPAAEGFNERGTNAPHKLERIVVFAKSDLSKPLSTTFFDYDYTLCQQVPNNDWTTNTPNNERGKLTLRKVWTEANGIVRSQMAPYQFHYDYYNKYEASIVAKYPWAATYNASASLLQNPNYEAEQLDAWGYFRKDGVERVRLEKFFVDQKPAVADFDPAAWQLKRIQLPSGGEIHVHYEQKDYVTVQDRRALVMVSLKDDDLTNNTYYSKDDGNKKNTEYRINLNDINVSIANIDEYVKLLRDHFLDVRNKLYFKALYSFRKDKTPELNNGAEFSQYVTGYTVVNDVLRDGNDIVLRLGDTRDKNADPTLPRSVCYQELLTNAGRNLGPNGFAYKDDDFTNNVYDSNGILQDDDLKKTSRNKVAPAVFAMFADWVTGRVKNTLKKNACKQLDYENSYFRLPAFHAKKGGGIRVTRVLAYDKGISSENGADAQVTGLEYIYKKRRVGSSGVSDGNSTSSDIYESESSGVAVNEPVELREENAMVTYLERKKQKWLNKILNGRDTKQFEGYMGEGLLPDASVVHSQVIVRNIHSNYDETNKRSSGTGIVINEYYTPRDFPFSAEWSELKKENNTMKRFGMHLPLGLINLDIDKAWVTQGYLFKSNDMSGKMKCSTTYASQPYLEPQYYPTNAFTSRTTYRYSQPGEDINTLIYNPNTKSMKRGTLKAGTEEDYTMYCSDVREKTVDFSIELDVNCTLILANVYPGIPTVSFNYTNDQLSQFLTSKVVSQTSFLLSTTTESDGVRQTSENLCFDRYTGNPVLTRTYDVFMSPGKQIRTTNDGTSKHDGQYYALSIPASWIYSEMGPKTNVLPLNQNRLSEYAGQVVTYGSNVMYSQLMSTDVWSPVSHPLSNVVSATAVMYTNNWFDASMSSDYPGLNFAGTSNPLVPAALPMANLVYYPVRTYNYRDVVKNANAAGGRIYEGGVTSQPFKFFDWVAAGTSTTSVPGEWYTDSYVTRYSPYGYPVEEQDVLNIQSAALYDANNVLPIAVGQNAARNEIVFRDFEQGISNLGILNNSTAHSGRRSMTYIGNQNYEFASDYPLNLQKGLSLKVWMKSFITTPGPNYGLKNSNPQLKANIGGQLFDFKKIAQTGEWTLYSADISSFNGLSGPQDIKLSYAPVAGESVYFDDFRAQPLNASVNCSSYYPDNRLAMQFDDQHFGVLYEYDNKGQLVRKSIETERGRKILQEKQYNTPLKNKN